MGERAAVGFIRGVATVKPVKHAWSHDVDAVSYSHARVIKLSPDGSIRAAMTTEGRDYGCGIAARIAKVCIEKLDPDGWFWNKLMYESPDSDCSNFIVRTCCTWRAGYREANQALRLGE